MTVYIIRVNYIIWDVIEYSTIWEWNRIIIITKAQIHYGVVISNLIYCPAPLQLVGASWVMPRGALTPLSAAILGPSATWAWVSRNAISLNLVPACAPPPPRLHSCTSKFICLKKKNIPFYFLAHKLQACSRVIWLRCRGRGGFSWEMCIDCEGLPPRLHSCTSKFVCLKKKNIHFYFLLISCKHGRGYFDCGGEREGIQLGNVYWLWGPSHRATYVHFGPSRFVFVIAH